MAINQIGNLGNSFGASGTGGELAGAQQAQTAASEQNQVAQINAQMESEQLKTQAQMHQIEEETNTKVSEMFRETNLNRAKSATKIHDKWVQQIMA